MERASLGRLGRNRLRIRGLSRGSPTRHGALAWLARRPEVTQVVHGEEVVDVDFVESEGPELFARALEDRLFTLERGAPSPLRLEISHSLKGRVRLTLLGGRESDAPRVAGWILEKDGVLKATASPASGTVLVVFDPALTSPEQLVRQILESDAAQWPDAELPLSKTQWRNTAFSTAVLAACVAELAPLPLLAAGVAVTAIPSLRRSLKAAREQRPSVDMLDVAAIGVSLASGNPGTAAFITWLLSVGDLLLERTADSARAAISRLVDLDAPEAFRIRDDGSVETVRAEALAVGDRVVVAPGRRVPADGHVLTGEGSVDEKALTGESLPRVCRAGDRVLAATVVVDGELVVTVERVGRDTTASRIVQVIEGAGLKPMTLQKQVEKIADQLVLPTFGVAGGALLLSGELSRLTGVLITDFGTGIRVATPTAALAAMGAAVRDGILVKGAQYLERLARADVVIFDKTGTLTEGRLEIVDVSAVGGERIFDVLGLCAAAEAQVAHPIAEAVRRRAQQEGIVLDLAEAGSFAYGAGRGLRSRVRGRNVLVGNARWMAEQGIATDGAEAIVARHASLGAASQFVAADGRLLGVIATADCPRRESRAVIEALQANGRRRVVLLSGDVPAAVEKVARELGIGDARGGMLPEDKAAVVKELQRQGHTVAMVGDGINDAPALALADVGISLHGSTEVALETADVVLLEGGLTRLVDAFAAGDRAMASVHRGLALVIVPNAVGIVLAAMGLVSPALAAVINNGSTVVATLAAVAPLLRPRAKEETR